MQGVYGRGTRSVNCYTWTFKVKNMTETIRQDRTSHPCSTVSVEEFGIFGLHNCEVCGEVGYIAAHACAGNLLKRHSCRLKTFECYFQELSLLGIHVLGFEVVDTEELIIKRSKITLDEVAPCGVNACWVLSVVVIERVLVES